MTLKNFFLIIFCNWFALNCTIETSKYYSRLKQDAHDVCVISLGSNCRNGTWLKEMKMRFQAFPFDWVESDEINGIIELLMNNFKDYVLFENLIPYYNKYFNRIRDKKYKINFVHDFSFQRNKQFTFENQDHFAQGMKCLKDEYEAFYQKCMRRIERFKNVAQNFKTVIFVRTMNVDQHTALQLYQALITLFKTPKKIILAVVNHTDDFKIDWGLEKIKNFYVPKKYILYDGYGQHFLEIIENILDRIGNNN